MRARHIVPVSLFLFIIIFCSIQSVRAQSADSLFGYYPMEVGNRWIYTVRYPGYAPRLHTIEITADTIMPNGHRYWKFAGVPGGTNYTDIGRIAYRRIDEPRGHLMEYDMTLEEERIKGWDEVLGDTTPESRRTEPVFGVERPVRTYGPFRNPTYYAYGLGMVEWSQPNVFSEEFVYTWQLRYARIGGTEHGQTEGVAQGEADRRADAPWLEATGSDGLVLRFTLPRSSHVRLGLVDMRGEEMAVLDGEYAAGEHYVEPEALGMVGGVYLAVLRSDAGIVSRRVVVTR